MTSLGANVDNSVNNGKGPYVFRVLGQYIVAAYCAIEKNRLDYIRQKQSDIRNEYLSGIYDDIVRGDRDRSDLGLRTLLTASFTGGPRYISSKVQQDTDVDKYVSTELPNPLIDADGYAVVSKLMIYGPCGAVNMNASCMKDGSTCNRHFPKINDRMAKMFELLKELTTSRAPEKVLIKEAVNLLVTKNVNSISLTKGEEEREDDNDIVSGDEIKKATETKKEVAVKEAKTKNGAKNKTKNKPIKKAEKEEAVEAPSSQHVKYYMKHMINEKLIERIVDNHRFNDSLSEARVGKINSPRGPVYEAILKIKITRKEDAGENFEIPRNIGGMKHINALVDQRSDGNLQMDLQDKKVIDSGCSRHMTRNMSYLIDYEEINRGYVAFGGNPKVGKITGKRVPRKNNTYSVDLKNIVPKGEAVNTACYVQNRVLVVKPHNKTTYKLFHGRTPTLSFMRPFRCLVTILNTKDPLGKFDGKADEGFFVGYSLNSNAFRVFNSRTKIVEENLHIKFCKSTPNVVNSRPNWLFDIDALIRTMNYKPIIASTQSNGFAGTKASDNAGQARKETTPIKDYILLPLWTADPPFSKYLKSSQDDGFKPSNDDGNKVDEDPRQESKCKDQDKQDNFNSTNTVNAASTNRVNVVDENISIKLTFDLNMPALKDIGTFDFLNENEDDDAVTDMNNLDTTIQVSPTPTTRIHKGHPLDQVIGDLHSVTQTRNMSKNLKEHGFVSTIEQRTNYKDLQKFLFACFFYKKNPKRNKKDERGIVIRNKSRLVAQGHTQEEGIDYDEVFTLVVRIKAIRLFLAYASFKNFVVYQIDVKGAFLYEKIEEEVYVCQPQGFEDPDFPDRVYKVEKALYGLHQAHRAWKDLYNAFEKLMHEKFQMSSMGELTLFLRLQVKKKNDGIFICQDKYVAEILKKFKFIKVKNASTPIETQNPLIKDKDGEEVDVYMYRSMIGSLMYLTSSRPDIMFTVCACARYQVNPKVLHLHAVKKIFRYLKGQPKLGLWCPKDYPFDLVAYTDSDYAGASLDRKSTTRGTTSGGGPRCPEAMRDTIAQTRFENVSKLFNDLLLARSNTLRSDEDSMKINELMKLCTNLQSRVLALKKTKTTQALEIDSLKRGSKSLRRSKDEPSLGEDASKQERKIDDIDVDEDIILVNAQDDAKIFDVNAVGELNAASIATIISVAATITTEEVTLPKALTELKASKPKVKGVFIQMPSESITTTTKISSKKSQDKGKGIMVEEPVKPKKKEQIRLDEEAALKLQQKEQKKRNKPPTQTQQRKIMCTYLKHMEGKKLKDLKNKSFDSIKKIFDKAFKRVNTFEPISLELVEGSSKRAGEEIEQERSKKQKVDDDKKTAELKKLMDIIPNEEGVAIDAIPLAIKYPKIVDWKIHKEGNKSYYQMIRADENSKMYMVFNQMLKEFDKGDLEDLYNLGKIVGIKRHLNAVRITAAHIDVNTALMKPNRKLIYNSIMNGPYVRQMIPEPSDADREVPINETFHEQTNNELIEN
nr:hypothetical protein [Tanacetum cinerariifolium]